MRAAIIVLAHRSPTQLALLLSQLQHPDIRVYVHLDRKSPLAPFRRELVERGSPSFFMIGRRRSRWGGIELVDAAMEGLARGVSDGCGYFFLISGQDFPIVPTPEIIEFARRSEDRSFLEFFPFPVEKWRYGGRIRTEFYTYTLFGRRETFIPGGEKATFSWKGRLINELLRIRTFFKPPRRFPSYLQAYGGSQWWNLSREAAEFVLRFVDDHPDYRAYHAHSLLPDEMFFQSILLGSGFAGDREVINDPLRFMIWEPGASHPKSLTVDDLPQILASGKLFARKIDGEVEGSVLPHLVRHFR
jgi:hypothetical protein